MLRWLKRIVKARKLRLRVVRTEIAATDLLNNHLYSAATNFHYSDGTFSKSLYETFFNTCFLDFFSGLYSREIRRLYTFPSVSVKGTGSR